MARAPKVTWRRVEESIASGMGTGFGEAYRPTLEIKRWNPSPMSVQVVKPVPPFNRLCHFFSHSEWYLALLFSWLGAHIREQYPLWPWPHRHPEYSRFPEIDATLPRSEGMEAICREAGIPHGVFVGTNIPYIWSIDLCIFMPWVECRSQATCFVSVKPLESERYLYVDPLDRGPEKLEAERRFAKQLELPYFIGDRSLYPGPIFAELEVLSEAALLPTQHPWAITLNRFLNDYQGSLEANPLSEIHDRLIKDYKASAEQATFLQHHMLWNQIVDCDVSSPIRESLPPRKGGKALRQALRKSLEGGRK